MKNSTSNAKSKARRTPLVLHLRRVRQWYGERGISRKELGELAGVTVRAIREYEALRRLPRCLESLLRISIALHRGVESLVDPRVLFELTKEVEVRRSVSRSAPCKGAVRRS